MISVFNTDQDPQFSATMFNATLKNEFAKRVEGGSVTNLYFEKLKNILIYYPSLEEQKKIASFFERIDQTITLQQRKLNSLQKLKKGLLQKMFPKNGENIPEIRFPEFSDAWKQRELNSLLTKYEDIVDTPHDGYFRLGLRSHGKGTFHSFVEKGKELETAKMQRVEANKFILNITFAWEHAVAITDENDKGKLVSHRFPQFSLDESLSPKFLKFLILDNNFRHYLELCSPGGAGRNRVLNISDMLKYKILVPQISEQQKIGSFFDKIDNTITLQQRWLFYTHKQS